MFNGCHIPPTNRCHEGIIPVNSIQLSAVIMLCLFSYVRDLVSPSSLGLLPEALEPEGPAEDLFLRLAAPRMALFCSDISGVIPGTC